MSGGAKRPGEMVKCGTCAHHVYPDAAVRSGESCRLMGDQITQDEPVHEDGTPTRCPLRSPWVEPEARR